jgi:hypothetical protein
MTITVEDGSIVTGANSYATEAQFNVHAAARGIALTGDNGTSEQLLILAMDYIESQNFIGAKLTKDQPLQWPRSGAVVDGFDVEETEIPDDLIFAQLEAAIAIDAGNNPMAPKSRETKREKVGDIEVEYSDGAKDAVELVAVNARLAKLVVGGSSGSSAGYVEIIRA